MSRESEDVEETEMRGCGWNALHYWEQYVKKWSLMLRGSWHIAPPFFDVVQYVASAPPNPWLFCEYT